MGLKGLPRPLLLAIRNTFRRKGRLALATAVLGIGGAVVLSVFSLQASIGRTLDRSFGFMGYDIRFTFPVPQPGEALEKLALGLPGVKKAESWYSATGTLLRRDGTKSRDLAIAAPPEDSGLLTPMMSEGRWLRKDQADIVLTSSFAGEEPDLRIGDSVTLTVQGVKQTWRVAGIVPAPKEVDAYVGYGSLTRSVGADGTASLLQLGMDGLDLEEQRSTAAELRRLAEEKGWKLNAPSFTAEAREVQEKRLGILIGFLAAMAVLLTVIASLGLMGMMSLNVLERSKEIGILRSIGAADSAVWAMVTVEGMCAALLGWGVSAGLAYPISRILGSQVGQSLFQAPLDYRYSFLGLALWLGVFWSWPPWQPIFPPAKLPGWTSGTC
ncbi:ABC transporter permease [Paenibacillus sp. CC-CFT747]|nr:ABC transporter permease [Paenibacillus sp. CC-CFT747]